MVVGSVSGTIRVGVLKGTVVVVFVSGAGATIVG